MNRVEKSTAAEYHELCLCVLLLSHECVSQMYTSILSLPCQEAAKDLEKQATAAGKQEKRKAADETHSEQRPRKLFKEQQEGEEDELEDEGRSDVPTPTSSPGEASGEAADGEDNDIFQGRFGKDAATQKQDPEPQDQDQPEKFETPKAKITRHQQPGTTPTSSNYGFSDDTRDLLAGMEDRLLSTIPSSFSRTGAETRVGLGLHMYQLAVLAARSAQ